MDTARKRVLIVSLLVLTVVAGFALRTTLNAKEARTDDGEFVLSGNDPYYHKHAVDHIVEEWETLQFDPMLNYPQGSVNPNPPLYEWSIAVGSQIAEPFTDSSEEATWWATLYSPAVFGALTIIPAYLIGRMFAGRWAGLLAGFLVATSPEHMSRSSLGFADHDAAILFFVTMGFYFLLTALRATGSPTDQTRLSELPSAFTSWLFEERRASGSAMVAGASLGAIGLIWKGFPYVFGILLGYAGIQFLVSHYKSRDVARPAFVVGTALALAALVSLPYYLSFGLLHFWYPSLYLLMALAALSTYFIAVQRYPSILVIPGLIIVIATFGVAMFFIFPGISQALLGRLVYFRSNVLYQTIAEARPAGFSNLSFTVGPIPFFMYVGGIFALMWRAWQDQKPAVLFFMTWAAVDLFLGISAIRFLSLIVPSMAILAAVATIWLLRMVKLPDLVQAYKRAGGRIFAAFSPVYGVVGALLALAVVAMILAGSLAFYITAGVLVYAYLHFLINDSLGLETGPNVIYISAVLFLGLLIIGPNAALGVDAAVPSGFESEKVREARAQALADVTQKARELGLSEDSVAEVRSAVNESQSKSDLDSRIQDIRIRLGLSQDEADQLFDSAADDFDTITLYRQRMGAFGQSFLPGGWHDALTWLAGQDTDKKPAERPAQVAWWDYGHWTISVGKHPAVADNFQNGYKLAGRWLVSQNETRSVQLMGASQASHFVKSSELTRDQYEQTLREQGISEFNATRLTDGFLAKNYPFVEFSDDPEENLEQSVDWIQTLEEISGKKIRYGAVDDRMLPIDDPNTPRIERPSIYYAPVTLAEQDPDGFVETQTVDMDTGEELSEEEIREIRRQAQQQQQQPNIGRQLKYKEAFFKSMYYRAYMGLPVKEPQEFRGRSIPQPFTLSNFEEFYRKGEPMLFGTGPLTGTALLRQPAAPGFGLDHHRLVYANDNVRILKYYPGAEVSGEVTMSGEPLEGLRVTAFDDAGKLVFNATRRQPQNVTPSDWDVPHDSQATDAQGNYELVAPFSTTDRGVEIRVTQNEASGGPGGLLGGGSPPTFTIANETLPISPAEAEQGAAFTVDFDIEPATVEGVAFHDVNRDGVRNASETLITNATITVAGETTQTDDNGRYKLTNITPGRRSLSAEAGGYELIGAPDLELKSGAEAEENVTFKLEPVPVDATVQDDDGSGVPNVRVEFAADEDSDTAQSKTSFSRRNGTLQQRGAGGGPAALQLQPGTYSVAGNGTDPRTETNYTVTGFAVVNGTGVQKTDDGLLEIEPQAEGVELTVRVQVQAD